MFIFQKPIKDRLCWRAVPVIESYYFSTSPSHNQWWQGRSSKAICAVPPQPISCDDNRPAMLLPSPNNIESAYVSRDRSGQFNKCNVIAPEDAGLRWRFGSGNPSIRIQCSA